VQGIDLKAKDEPGLWESLGYHNWRPWRERVAGLGRLTWQVGTVAEIRQETATARTIAIDVPGWPGHAAGQHVDVRLTAEDGYTAQRSYSIASPPGRDRLELTVQRLEDGEVSSYLTDVLMPGYPLELRGPIGGWFVWDTDATGPVLLVAGGSGVVPLMSMIRARAEAGSRAPFRLVYSVRSPETALYAAELAERSQAGDGLEVSYVYTRSAPPGARVRVGRLNPVVLAAPGWTREAAPAVFICGPTGFVEAAAQLGESGRFGDRSRDRTRFRIPEASRDHAPGRQRLTGPERGCPRAISPSPPTAKPGSPRRPGAGRRALPGRRRPGSPSCELALPRPHTQLRTYGDLTEVTADLPAPGQPPPGPVATAPGTFPADRIGGEPGAGVSVAILGGVDRGGTWVVPPRHSVVAVLGGVHVDLREARFSQREADIDVFTLMGGVDIWWARTWTSTCPASASWAASTTGPAAPGCPARPGCGWSASR
jgi:ferredoxin-NADP reductase